MADCTSTRHPPCHPAFCNCDNECERTGVHCRPPEAPVVLGDKPVRVQLGEVKRVRIELARTGRHCKVLFDDVEQDNVFSVQVQAEVNGVSSVLVGFYPKEGIIIEGEGGDVVRLDRSNDRG